MKNSLRESIQELIAPADIKINGPRKWDIQVNNEKFYKRVLSGGSLALGESYMDGWWDVEKLDEFFYRIFKLRIMIKFKPSVGNLRLVWYAFRSKYFNLQSKSRVLEVAKEHYDLGNDLFEVMLDKRMVYSCGYWKNAKTLDKAQENKFELICKKIGLKKGNRILDIGCGFGSFLKYAAEKYGISGVGLTISKEQAEFAKISCKGLPIKILLQDYRSNIKGAPFDHIVSIGMFEHVGVKNYREFMQVVHRNLKDKGLFLLHTIGNHRTFERADPWINKYIFPNGKLPSIQQIGRSIEGLFKMQDWHNFGTDYDKTLMAWHKNFNDDWEELKDRYGERFKRMWDYYLLLFAGSFRSENLTLWQIVLSKKGVENGYKSIR